MVGDGVTDMQAKAEGAADAFVGYGGVVKRQVVADGADLFITKFSELIQLIRDSRQV
jgi:phosphoserine phosphatase